MRDEGTQELFAKCPVKFGTRIGQNPGIEIFVLGCPPGQMVVPRTTIMAKGTIYEETIGDHIL